MIEKNELTQDFFMTNCPSYNHMINEMSPVFTVSFELTEYIFKKNKFTL